MPICIKKDIYGIENMLKIVVVATFILNSKAQQKTQIIGILKRF